MEFNFLTIIDLVVTGLIFYKFVMLIRGTRAIQLLKGVLFLFFISFISQQLGFQIFNYLLEQIRTIVLIAIPVIFQPELRRALEKIGRDYLTRHDKVETNIDQIVAAIIRLSESQTGALIVLKRHTGIKEIIDTGLEVDAILSAELLINIFTPKTPLHDGAVIVEKNRIIAANCLLPLTEKRGLSSSLGTRHRAALGISEESDALALVVSEETGTISLANHGKFKYNLDEFSLKEELFKRFEHQE
ncbi:TIGR00159 family protein [Halobacteroides halobius DSM 5150]|uniref:Diadenylate cyclase n=1 Tax=Halobacteroides halobius (strain ATCC 35273 / DSM 5150 / MD-1) TaxID=748449 RepID=L0K5M2_HALHC|nr:diadenylate cyclase CdaA [Halobacteroides halobius]AGB40286.1 TIGR00159 family protein [Halobacteroides halobius DSM 5150]